MAEQQPYRLSAEQVELRDAVRRLARERIAPRAAEVDRTPRTSWPCRSRLSTAASGPTC